MLGLRHRLAIAGVASATAIAVPAAALASGPGSPSGKPAPLAASAAGASKSAAVLSPKLAVLAATAGISTRQLQAGLAAAERGGGDTAAGIAAFAASAGVSPATAQRVVYAVWGTSPSGKPAPPQASAASASKSAAAPSQLSLTVPAAVRALATRLGVSTGAAGRAFKQIAALINQNRGVDPASPAFAAIAHDLGVSPAQLAAAWDAVRHSAAGK